MIVDHEFYSTPPQGVTLDFEDMVSEEAERIQLKLLQMNITNIPIEDIEEALCVLWFSDEFGEEKDPIFIANWILDLQEKRKNS